MEISRSYIQDIVDAYEYNSASTEGYADRQVKELIAVFRAGGTVVIKDDGIELKSLEEFIRWNSDNKMLTTVRSLASKSPAELFQRLNAQSRYSTLSVSLKNDLKSIVIKDSISGVAICCSGILYHNTDTEEIESARDLQFRYSHIHEIEETKIPVNGVTFLTIESSARKKKWTIACEKIIAG